MIIRRSLISAVAVATISVATAGAALATTDVQATRLAGADRYGTSRAIADATFTAGATVAVVASGQSYPDALAASYLAGAIDGPVVLTTGGALNAQALGALQDVGATGAIVVGGPDAVSDAVLTELRNAGIEPQRVAGNDRYQTARAIAESVPAEQIGSYDVAIGRTAILASGEGFADALAAGPLAYASAYPLLLTDGDMLSEAASTAMTNLGIEQVIVVGGPDAISAAVFTAVEARGIDAFRVAGMNRQETAVRVADLAVDQLGYSSTHVNVARGDGFADALSGSADAGEELGVILLTVTPDQLGTPARDWLASKAETLATIHVYGGPEAVTDATLNAAEVAAGRAP